MERFNSTLPAAAAPVQPASVRGPTRHNQALMIVGGVGILLGAIIGGDPGTVIMIGSGAVGLWGLYQYLQ